MNAILLVLVAAAVAAFTDITRRKISNMLVGAVLAVGLVLQAVHGLPALAASLGIFAIALAGGTVAFTWGIAGGGDVKFLAAACAALGWPLAAPFFFYTLLAGGLLAIGFALHRRSLRSTAANLGLISLSFVSGVRPQLHRSRDTDMPYAVAMLTGAVMLAWNNQLALHILRIAQ